MTTITTVTETIDRPRQGFRTASRRHTGPQTVEVTSTRVTFAGELIASVEQVDLQIGATERTVFDVVLADGTVLPRLHHIGTIDNFAAPLAAGNRITGSFLRREDGTTHWETLPSGAHFVKLSA